jgi:hypothetical protein
VSINWTIFLSQNHFDEWMKILWRSFWKERQKLKYLIDIRFIY